VIGHWKSSQFHKSAIFGWRTLFNGQYYCTRVRLCRIY